MGVFDTIQLPVPSAAEAAAEAKKLADSFVKPAPTITDPTPLPGPTDVETKVEAPTFIDAALDNFNTVSTAITDVQENANSYLDVAEKLTAGDANVNVTIALDRYSILYGALAIFVALELYNYMS